MNQTREQDGKNGKRTTPLHKWGRHDLAYLAIGTGLITWPITEVLIHKNMDLNLVPVTILGAAVILIHLCYFRPNKENKSR